MYQFFMARMVLTIHVLIWTILVASGYTCVGGSLCVNEAQNKYLPVVRFCTDDSGEGNPIVIDGYYANSLNGVKSCTCTARPKLDTASKITYNDNDLLLTPIHNDTDCGSTVEFRQDAFENRSHSCQIDGCMSINGYTPIDIILIKNSGNEDTRYCFKLHVDHGNIMKLECENANLTVTTTKTSQLDTVSPETSEDTHHSMTTDSPDSTNTIVLITKENSPIVYIAIGGGAGGLLLVAIIVVCLVNKSRKRKKENKDHNDTQEHDNDYGLQYNTFYVSSVHDGIQQNVNNQQSIMNKTRVEYEVEGDYSEINIREMPMKRTNVSEIKTNTSNTITEGNYSEIDLEKNRRSSDSRIQSEMSAENITGKEYSKQSSTIDKDNGDSSSPTKHIFSPGDGGCEYAVVVKRSTKK